MVLRCYMPGCINKGKFRFHKFPRNVEMCKKWQYISRTRNIDPKQISYSHYRLCSKHFRKEDYLTNSIINPRLKKNVLPSLFIPEDNPALEDHNYSKVSISEKEQENEENEQFENRDNCVNSDSDSIPKPDKEQRPKIKGNEERNLSRQLRYNRTRVQFLQKKLKESKNFTNDKVIRYLSSKFTKEQMTFFTMQLRNSGRKNHGQNYTKEEKCMLLSVYKHGARCYRFLSQLFALPSKRTLNRHSALLQFKTGINPKLFKFLKSKAQQMDNLDKYCTIGWDEMALTTHLNFCNARDALDGFVDFGSETIPEFATHALVFMIRGVNKAYKQPVAYFFTNDLGSYQLAGLVKLVIAEVLNSGMKIIGSVCDQTQTNAGAVNFLINPNWERGKPVKQEGQLLEYVVQGHSIVHCFDPPHIIKVIRNNLYTKNLTHFVSNVWDYYNKNDAQVKSDTKNNNVPVKNEVKTASWDDIRDFYNFNVQSATRLIRKITPEHIDPVKLKMKVYIATQVFSNTLGNIMLFCSEHKQFKRDFSGTGSILLFFNNVFDSLNGGDIRTRVNPLRSPINAKNKDNIFEFWEYAIAMLEKMNFVEKATGKINNNSSVLKKTTSTIKGYMKLTKLCLSLGIESVSLRRMNQDALENFFGNVRSNCQVKKQPMPFQFRSAFTNLIVSNLTAKHSIKSNCQDDRAFALLQDVTDIYDTDLEDEVEDDEDIIHLDVEDTDENPPIANEEALVLQSANVCASMLLKTKCTDCRNTLEAYCPLTQHEILKACETTSNVENRIFTYPTVLFTSHFKLLFKKVETLLPFVCSEHSLSKKLIKSLDSDALDGLGCQDHAIDVSKEIKATIVKLNIDTFRKDINNILRKKTLDHIESHHDIYTKAFKVQRNGVRKHGQAL